MDAVIVLLGGDGIGPDVTQAARQVMQSVADSYGHRFTFKEELMGGAAIDAVKLCAADQHAVDLRPA